MSSVINKHTLLLMDHLLNSLVVLLEVGDLQESCVLLHQLLELHLRLLSSTHNLLLISRIVGTVGVDISNLHGIDGH